MADSYHTLEADLERHQASGNIARQANTLTALVTLANHEARYNTDEDLFGILQARCLQACAVYKRLGDRKRMASVIKIMVDAMYEHWDHETHSFNGPLRRPDEFLDMYQVAAAIYAEVGYLQGQVTVYKIIGELYRGEAQRLALQQALVLCEQMGNRPEQATILYALSWCYPPGSPESQHVLARALEMYEALNDDAGQKAVHERLKWVQQHNRPPRQSW